MADLTPTPSASTTYEHCIETAGIALASGDHANAERALRAAIQSIEGQNDCHLELATALIKLGTLKQDTGSIAEAESLFRRALEIGERALGSDHLGLVPALKGLGATLILQGAPESAEPSMGRALAISERHLGADHPDLVILLNDLTRLYIKQSAHAFAEPLLLRLLELKRSKGDDHPEVATVLASLAAVRQALGRHEAAEQLWRRVLTIRERTLAPNHFAMATALEHLAETCSARGKLAEATQLFQRALTIRETTLGRDHASLRKSRERIADLELQASEELPEDGGGLPHPVIVPPTERPKLLSDDELSLSVGAPLRARSAMVPAVVPPIDLAPAIERAAARPLDRFVAPTAGGLEMTSVQQASADGSYLDVLQDIQHELREIDEPALATVGSTTRGVGLFKPVGAFLQKHRAATIAGVGVITLPLAAWGVAGATRSMQPKFVENPAAVSAPKPEPGLPDVASAEIARALADSAARLATKTDKSSSSKTADTRQQGSAFSLPAAPTLVVRVDSVRAVNAPLTVGGESVLRHLSGSADLRNSGALAADGVQRARLIGTQPVPRYPAQQFQARTTGEVRARFDVDTLGRPVMSTFSVVGSPIAPFVKAVKEVIPGIRFEPARTPWPESRRMVETVELVFQFSPSGKTPVSPAQPTP